MTTHQPITGTGIVLGTLPYMAPEQLDGREADARTDVFALGAVLYQMLTGKRPFEGSSQATLIGNILHAEPLALASAQPLAPRALDRLIRQCLAKDREERWQSALDLKRELQWITAPTEGSVARPPRYGVWTAWSDDGDACSRFPGHAVFEPTASDAADNATVHDAAPEY